MNDPKLKRVELQVPLDDLTCGQQYLVSYVDVDSKSNTLQRIDRLGTFQWLQASDHPPKGIYAVFDFANVRCLGIRSIDLIDIVAAR